MANQKQAVGSGGKSQLREAEANRFLAARGVNMVACQAAPSPEEAAKMAASIGFPVVLKLDSPEILHKTEAGGVVVGLATTAAVRAAGHEILKRAREYRPNAEIIGLLVQPLIKGGREVIIGGVHDPQFGPVVMFGLGGIHTEVLRDLSFRMAPLTFEHATDMIQEIRGFPILCGTRGQGARDITSLAELLVRIGQVMVDHPEIGELDLNPVAVLGEGSGCVVLDALIRLR